MARRSEWLWTGGLAALALLALGGAEARGRGARTFFAPPPEFRGGRWAMVGDAGQAFRVWRAAGLHGRAALVLTGRWSRPRSLRERPPTPREMAAGPGGPAEAVDADSALFAAAQLGIARRLEVVLPPAVLERRLGEVAGRKELVRERGAYRLPYEAVERRFSAPEAFAPPGEPVLVLVEPSFFQAGAPGDPAAWLASRGAAFDLGLVALEDPAADAGQREAARLFAAAQGAVFVEAGE